MGTSSVERWGGEVKRSPPVGRLGEAVGRLFGNIAGDRPHGQQGLPFQRRRLREDIIRYIEQQQHRGLSLIRVQLR
ncbi:MAG: hypothetical protein ACE5IB_03815 [Candidatus Geothermarchaeales archaeon]